LRLKRISCNLLDKVKQLLAINHATTTLSHETF
jgi:hypothetical protein